MSLSTNFSPLPLTLWPTQYRERLGFWWMNTHASALASQREFQWNVRIFAVRHCLRVPITISLISQLLTLMKSCQEGKIKMKVKTKLKGAKIMLSSSDDLNWNPRRRSGSCLHWQKSRGNKPYATQKYGKSVNPLRVKILEPLCPFWSGSQELGWTILDDSCEFFFVAVLTCLYWSILILFFLDQRDTMLLEKKHSGE